MMNMARRKRVTFGGSDKKVSFMVNIKMRSESEVRARLKTLTRQYKELEKGGLSPVSHFSRSLRHFSLGREIAQLRWVLYDEGD